MAKKSYPSREERIQVSKKDDKKDDYNVSNEVSKWFHNV